MAEEVVVSRKPQNIASVLVAGLLWGVLWAFRLQWSSAEESLWITFLYILCVLPTILFLFGHKLRSPFMPIWGLGYFLLFGMPMLSDDQQVVLGFMNRPKEDLKFYDYVPHVTPEELAFRLSLHLANWISLSRKYMCTIPHQLAIVLAVILGAGRAR